MRSAPPIAPGMPRRNASPAMPASCAAFATRTSGTAAPARTRAPGSIAISPKPRPSRITTPGDAAVAHDQVGAEADDGDGNLGRKMGEEIREIVLVLRHEQHLRRPADAKPGELGQRLVGEQAAAQRRHRGFERSGDVGEGHAGTAPALPLPACGERVG